MQTKEKERNKMKKLMIVAAVVCAAVASQAAAVSWETSPNYFNGNGKSASSDSGTLLGKDKMTGYFWILATEDAYNAALAKVTAQDGTTASWAKDYIAANSETAISKNTKNAGTLTFTDGKDDYGEGATVYALIIGTTKQDGTDYFYANVAQADVQKLDVTVSAMNVNLGGDGTGAGATAILWNSAAAVPEPTSGLLLLLGVAGLALRRRRA